MNILTFDVEDWFQILDNESTKNEKEWLKLESRIEQNMERIFALLDKNNQQATFFCLGWVARKYPQLLKRIDAAGFEIATHSDMHQLAYEFDKNEFRADLQRSIGSIEEVVGKKVRAYRAPGFSLMKENQWVFEELIAQGIEIDCSVFPAKRAHGGFEEFGYAEPAYIELHGQRIKEFPINTYSVLGQNVVFSGGGYFRLFPYSVIKFMMARSPYVMSYLHPRDFDPQQPMIEGLSVLRKFKSYYGLNGAYAKLEKMIEAFSFVDLKAAELAVDWETARVIKL